MKTKPVQWHCALRKTVGSRAEAEAIIANRVLRQLMVQSEREVLRRRLAEGFEIVGRPYFGRFKIVDDTAHPVTVGGRGRFWIERAVSAWIRSVA